MNVNKIEVFRKNVIMLIRNVEIVVMQLIDKTLLVLTYLFRASRLKVPPHSMQGTYCIYYYK